MIICKIIANYTDENGNFKKLFDKLSDLGGVHYSHGSLFFGCEQSDMDNKKLKKIVRSCGYKDSIIVEYNENNMPKEDQVDNGWITDWQAKLMTIQFEQNNQEVMKGAIKALDKLDDAIDEAVKAQMEVQDVKQEKK